MNPFRRLIDRLDRRRTEIDPAGDRRKPTMEEAKARVDAALDDLERTIIRKRTDMPANDLQTQVKFETFAAICEFRYQNGHAHSICKHQDHEGFGTGVSVCAEVCCPILFPPKKK